MKTTLIQSGLILGVALLTIATAPRSLADKPEHPQKDQSFKGTLTAVHPSERTVSVRSFWRTRTFNAADNCKIKMEDKSQATLADLRAGQEVEIQYQNADGVLVADTINQKDLEFAGQIAEVDTTNRTVSVHHRGLTWTFDLSPHCTIKKKGQSVSLTDLAPGQAVNVVYVPNNDSKVASRIEQRDSEFVGIIRAIDAETRTVKAKSFLNDRKFNLADGCQIRLADQSEGKLSDLRIGDKVAFSYEDNNGVLITHSIGLEEPASKRNQDNEQASAVRLHR